MICDAVFDLTGSHRIAKQLSTSTVASGCSLELKPLERPLSGKRSIKETTGLTGSRDAIQNFKETTVEHQRSRVRSGKNR